jgi:Ran GTPase-activating protein (RanGAP) involved in mRNA processing and transport
VSTLQTLNLADNHICAQGAAHLSGQLDKMTALKTLNIRLNAIGAEGIKHLERHVRSGSINIPGLTTLQCRAATRAQR